MQELGNDRALNAWLLGPLVVACLVAAVVAAADAGGKPQEIQTPAGVKMILLPGGSFTMGDPNGSADEAPHKVSVSPFYIDKYKVSQEDYQKVTNENPSKWKAKDHPVEEVRWSDAVRYCNLRSKLDGLKPCYDLTTWECDFTANGYRLPTEAEWEYAARGGTNTRYFFGDDRGKLKLYGWFKDNSGGRTRPLGQKLPNPFGLYDAYGNVWEWCNDFYKVDYYKESPATDPRGPQKGKTRVLRGGCWNTSDAKCSSAYRYNEDPGYTDPCFGYDIYGFRCVRSATEPGGSGASAPH